MKLLMIRFRFILAVALWFSLSSPVRAQDAVPVEILNRTLLIKVGNTFGTAFVIDYEGKLYIVTARHVVAGLPEMKATIQIQRSNQWLNINTVRTLFPKSKDVDIAVFETDEKVAQPFQIKSTELSGVTMGQPVWFLGYPYGLGSHFGTSELKKGEVPLIASGVAPFIKRGTMSAIDGSKPDAVVLYIDGFNNPGFSGGPIVYWDFGKRGYGIVGVVQGYRLDNAKTVVNGQQVDSDVLVNSGILIGYSIDHAIQAIKQGQAQHQ
jgi:S1-C subfamily serine protease